MSEPVIVFENVGKSYPQYHQITGGLKNFLFHLPSALKSFKQLRYESLRDINFQMAKGESLGIVGRNGAGKSTTLGLIAGVLQPTVGRVLVRERVSPMLELGAGFCTDLSGRDNIMLNGILMGMTRMEVQKKVDEIIEFAELGEFINQPIRIYSSGMLARLGFSVVSSLEPEILLIDEILAVGDIDFTKKCQERMMRFKKQGVTIVLVSHVMQDIVNICDRVLWIENHTAKCIGPAEEVVQKYKDS
ncbi:ABC transporter ATP-binding protein [candidate division FCPU426 bacterium]|nr:ABC transporter ATP-binding protein [candidate division FCPU426 bacterium]